MKRIKLVLAALAVMVAAFAAFSAPAMADDLNCRDASGDLISCDGQFYAPVDNGYYNNGYGYPDYGYGYPDYGYGYGNNFVTDAILNNLYNDGYGYGYDGYGYGY